MQADEFKTIEKDIHTKRTKVEKFAETYKKNIKEIYIMDDSSHIIYRDKLGVAYYIDDESRKGSRMAKNFDKIATNIACIDVISTHIKWNPKATYKPIARAYSQAFKGEIESAKKILGDIEKKLTKLIQIEGRLNYLIGANLLLILTAVNTLFSIIYGDSSIWKDYSQVTLCGALGGALSVFAGIKNIEFDLNIGRGGNITFGALRIIIAIIASVFVYLTIQSNIILPEINPPFGTFVLAFTAGFSETYVPNILDKLSNNKNPSKI